MANKSSKKLNRTLSIAPMMDWTDRHERYFLRLITRHTLLYTEMVTTGALLHGDRERFLHYSPEEHPVALQLGGSNPEELAACTKLAEDWGYDEVNLNVGCPSDRVQNGRIGACLMAEPETVANCLAQMQKAVSIPVTVKHRIGINGREEFEQLCQFVETVSAVGCETFIIHARIAILEGLSPKENREIPPLKYEWVYAIKKEFPHLEIILNGGVNTMEAVQQHLSHIDGVMIGREAYQNPYILAHADTLCFNDHHHIPSRHEILSQFYPYIEKELDSGTRLHHLSRHILGLFQGQPGGRQFRRYLSENACKPGSSLQTLQAAAALTAS
ncbi:tRNA dihydrouridine(20/20a) synthase DusA [Zooshikella ganghwensis]|uniref:tRNA-dihydrouridine(20/20a) synthase n=1 Tax=Zooshikella ganghwensis TaxID=202772 RepID=A0A4P9VN10_9GAMM|nr:tRNA dihydrouridine(20/20a) synthase DusA [Zooshikella ganghwensis]RDH44815.1 tRNA dihydrouridine(20/20a) synthase DusA [Zooshikella ganghwensis]